MREEKPRQREEQNGGRPFVQAEACEHEETADIHRIAHELVRTSGYELARRVHWRGRAFAASDERRYAGEGESSTGSHQGDTQSERPAGKDKAKSRVVAAVQAQCDPAPQKNESCTEQYGAKRDEERFHSLAPLEINRYFVQLLLNFMLSF